MFAERFVEYFVECISADRENVLDSCCYANSSHALRGARRMLKRVIKANGGDTSIFCEIFRRDNGEHTLKTTLRIDSNGVFSKITAS